MPSWEELTMFDRALHLFQRNASPLYPKKTIQQTVAIMRQARRFEVSNRAAERIRDAMASYPELIFENSEFAIPPFPIMWVEFDSRVMLHHDVLSPFMSGGTEDWCVGYLFNRGFVTVFAEGQDREPMALPLGYRLHKPMSLGEQQELAALFNVSRIGIDPFLWGHTLSQYLDEETKRGLRDRHSVVLPSHLRDQLPEVWGDTARDVYYGSAGELRNILGLLLALNQPAKILSYREVPRRRGFIRGKPTPYFGHSVIDINLDRRQRMNLLAKPHHGEHASPRWHEVRGHFCHDRTARLARHEHVWVEVSPRKWECGKCGGRRWWREYPNGRGSAAKGFVHQERRIRTKEDRRAKPAR